MGENHTLLAVQYPVLIIHPWTPTAKKPRGKYNNEEIKINPAIPLMSGELFCVELINNPWWEKKIIDCFSLGEGGRD